MGMTEGPVHQSIQRWPLAMPQYLVGHQDRLDAVDAVMRHVRGVFLTGAAYRGVGIASCVADAGRIATAVAAHLTQDVAATDVAATVANSDVSHNVTPTLADNRPDRGNFLTSSRP
jgi:heterodisulfide reductase subunit A-like polyferredoxin